MTSSVAIQEGWIPLAGQGNPDLEEMMVSYLGEHEVALLKTNASPLKDYSAVVNTANKFPREKFAEKVAQCNVNAQVAQRRALIEADEAAKKESVRTSGCILTIISTPLWVSLFILILCGALGTGIAATVLAPLSLSILICLSSLGLKMWFDPEVN